jgi:hypothetical protein
VNSSSHGAVTLQTNEGTLFKVNGHRLKIFLKPENFSAEVDSLDFVVLT